MTDGAPIPPLHDLASAPFWEGTRAGELRIPSCDGCGSWSFPGSVRCASCGASALTWTTVVPEGTIYALTVSAVPMRPGLPAPYAIVLVDLDAAPPGVRLTMRVAGSDDVAAPLPSIGAAVRIDIEQHDAVAVPVAVVTGDRGVEQPDVPPPSFSFVRPADKAEDRVVIGGVGRSAIGRALMRSDLDLAVEAATAAVADAGLTMADIDGIATYPGSGVGPPGYSGPHTDDVARALDLEISWRRGGAEGAGQLQPLFDAVAAVASGCCRHALVYRCATESTAAALDEQGTLAPPAMAPAAGFTQWLLPFDAISPAHWLAPYQERHMHRYGTTREQVGAVAVTARRHAASAPGAVFTDPITIDDYLGARMISSPIGLLDCDVPVDGAIAVVVSAVDTAGDLRDGAPVAIEAIGAGVGSPPAWHQWPDLTTMGASGAAASMWARTDLRAADVRVGQLYDGFAFLALYWLEAMGFCGPGEGGAFVAGGERITFGGTLPLNTQGGQLSGGRLHGWGFLEEGIHQVRGTATGRQVDGAEVAAVSTGGGPIAGCLLLRKH